MDYIPNLFWEGISADVIKMLLVRQNFRQGGVFFPPGCWSPLTLTRELRLCKSSYVTPSETARTTNMCIDKKAAGRMTGVVNAAPRIDSKHWARK